MVLKSEEEPLGSTPPFRASLIISEKPYIRYKNTQNLNYGPSILKTIID